MSLLLGPGSLHAIHPAAMLDLTDVTLRIAGRPLLEGANLHVPAGTRVALGTDGRVSNPDLNLLTDARHVAREFPSISPADVLAMITLNAAEALGLAAEVGSLKVGKRADLAVLALTADSTTDPCEAILGSDYAVVRTMQAGAWV